MTRERVYRGKDDLIYCREEAEPISLPRRDAITGCDWGNINLLRKLLFFFSPCRNDHRNMYRREKKI